MNGVIRSDTESCTKSSSLYLGPLFSTSGPTSVICIGTIRYAVNDEIQKSNQITIQQFAVQESQDLIKC